MNEQLDEIYRRCDISNNQTENAMTLGEFKQYQQSVALVKLSATFTLTLTYY